MKRRLSFLLISAFLLSTLSGCFKAANNTVSKDNIPKDAIVLKLMIGRDKDWVFDNVNRIVKEKNIKVNGKPIYITYEKAGTGEAMDKILEEGSDYVGWMPASSTHVLWANQQWYKKGHTKPIVGENYTTVFLTPTVIAMQESLAKVMGYPDKQISWQDILKLSTATEGWGIYGKAVLNPVRFAHTHPAFSNSGLNSLIAEEYAFSGKQKDLTLEDIKNNSQKLKQVEQTIVHYGQSTSLLEKKILEKGPKFIQYAVLYEYMVAGMNKQAKNSEKIVAIYPSEGTIWGDVCFTNVYSTKVSDNQKKALEEVKKILISKEMQEKGMNEYFFRPAASDIPLSNAITLANGVNPIEPQTTLQLPKIEVIDAILNDWKKNMKKRADVLFVLDTSGSMQGEPLDNAVAAMKNLFSKSAQDKNYTNIDNDDTLSLMSFNSNINQPYTVKGSNANDINLILSNLNAGGQTALYDAIYKAIKEHNQIKQKEKEKKIDMIVFLTDGKDTASSKSFDELINYIQQQEGNIPVIITIGYGTEVDENILGQIADKTGGKYYKGDPKTINDVFKEIKTFF